jgi:benzil reductase ((S)-benzoin forming)
VKLAIITGGSRGLGKALVQWYLQQGWTVKELSRSGQSENHIDCDFSDAKQTSAVMNQTFAELSQQPWSEILLINNAGTVNPTGPIETTIGLDWQQNLQINLNSLIVATGLFIKKFAKTRAIVTVVNISSGAAVTPFHGWSLYCAAKAGVEAFSACVAMEQQQARHPAKVYSIRPGVIDTEMQQQIRAQDQSQFAEIERFKALKRDGQLATADETAEKIADIIADSPQTGGVYDVNDYALNTNQ